MILYLIIIIIDFVCTRRYYTKVYDKMREDIKQYDYNLYRLARYIQKEEKDKMCIRDRSLASLKLKDSDVGSTFGNYLQTVRYTDESFGKLIEYLKKNDMYDNTVIAIYGDHQGMNKETPSVQWKMTDFLGKEYDYDEMLNVPFIIHIPGLNESKVDVYKRQ